MCRGHDRLPRMLRRPKEVFGKQGQTSMQQCLNFACRFDLLDIIVPRFLDANAELPDAATLFPLRRRAWLLRVAQHFNEVFQR